MSDEKYFVSQPDGKMTVHDDADKTLEWIQKLVGVVVVIKGKVVFEGEIKPIE